MAQIVLFNHVPKTAGSTMKFILWRVAPGRVHFAVEKGRHVQRVPELFEELDRPLAKTHIIVSHTGAGVEKWLPRRHSYSMFTLLRDPVERVLSHYHFGLDRSRKKAGLPEGMTLKQYLDEVPLYSFNLQTAFLAGLHAEHQLTARRVCRDDYGQKLLAKAKKSLERHQAFGLTERFDESLLLLRDAFRWPMWRTLYRRENVGKRRKASATPAQSDIDAVKANNQLDLQLYDFATELFETRLANARRRTTRLATFQALNEAFPAVLPTGRRLVRAGRAMRLGPAGR